jgi:photosystem II stability/assembly factor-like uncharacterized protein
MPHTVVSFVRQLRIRRVAASLAALALIVALVPVSSAETPAVSSRPPGQVFGNWSVTGPFGGSVRSLAVAPDDSRRIYIATSDGQLYRSRDGGGTWSRAIPGFDRPGLVIDNLLIDPRNPATMYVGVWSIASDQKGGVFKSVDAGETWRELPGMHDKSVRALALAPGNSRILVLGALDGVHRSVDGGETWERISPAGHDEIRNIESVAVDPRDSNAIYVGTWHLPWKTTDGGATWNSIKQGILDDSDIFSIAVIRETPDHVFASACSGIYHSLDAGANWSKVQGIPFTSRRTRIILPHPSRTGTVFAGTTQGLWRTQDAGKSWQLMTTKSLVVNDIDVHPENPDVVLLATDNHGVLVSNDSGQSFLESNVGFINRHVLSVVPDLTQPGRVYATVFGDGVAGGLFVSNDRGMTWRQSIKGLGGRDIFAMYQDPDLPTTLFLGTNFGVYRSTDRGDTWKFVGTPKKKAPPKKQTVEEDEENPAPPPRRKKGRSRWSSRAATDAGLRSEHAVGAFAAQRSRPARQKPAPKRGKPRVKTPPAPTGPPLVTLEMQVNHFTRFVDAEGKKWLLAATATGLFRTLDPDKGWEQIKTDGLAIPLGTVAASDVDPQRTIFLGTARGLALSRDFGVTWERVGRGPDEESVKSIVQDPRDPNTIYVGCRGALFKSTDGGRSWRRRGGGLPGGDITVVTLDPRDPDTIYAGDYLVGGIYRSRDRAESWERLDSGLPSARVWALAPDPFDPGRLYAGSFSGGVYVFTDAGRGQSTN